MASPNDLSDGKMELKPFEKTKYVRRAYLQCTFPDIAPLRASTCVGIYRLRACEFRQNRAIGRKRNHKEKPQSGWPKTRTVMQSSGPQAQVFLFRPAVRQIPTLRAAALALPRPTTLSVSLRANVSPRALALGGSKRSFVNVWCYRRQQPEVARKRCPPSTLFARRSGRLRKHDEPGN
ncbi:hypothetical protein B0H16DRAFT_1453970 [Mycena metata]|uniref:Uncharacterized protein n=1 Tax=Mycena metata TaxID=1033252 RepID=A0AAD7JLZ8_9AGAR|nr:hypothetical protein B0H16DRAFT_1453970 [Mycena metata]